MPELPWIKWFPADWISDPGLAMCDAATRGIWADVVNYMLLSNKASISGTIEELSRLCRCRYQQMEVACLELEKFNVCIVEQANSKQTLSKTLTSRRLSRLYSISELRKEAGSKGGAKRKQTPKQASASASEYASKREGVQGKGGFKKPTREELELQASKIGLPQGEVDRFLNYYESNGWRVGKNPMKSWTHALSNWKLNCNNGNYNRSGSKPNPRNTGVCRAGPTGREMFDKRIAQQEEMARQMAEAKKPPPQAG